MENINKIVKHTNMLVLILILKYGVIGINGVRVERGSSFGRAPILEKFAWKIMDYAYPSRADRQEAIHTGDFHPENVLPVGIEIWRNKLFVTTPRWKQG